VAPDSDIWHLNSGRICSFLYQIFIAVKIIQMKTVLA